MHYTKKNYIKEHLVVHTPFDSRREDRVLPRGGSPGGPLQDSPLTPPCLGRGTEGRGKSKV